MQIFDVIKRRNYLIIVVVAAVFMFFFYPFVQTFGVQTDLWYSMIPLPNLVLFLIFSGLFGMFVSFQVARFRGPKVCSTEKKGTVGGVAGTIFGFFVGVCPSCVGFAGLFFPVAIVTTLTIFGPLLIMISIGLMLLAIYFNGGFKK